MVFLDGFWLAEYELKSPKDELPKIPEWVRKEVTGDPRYSNAAMVFEARAFQANERSLREATRASTIELHGA